MVSFQLLFLYLLHWSFNSQSLFDQIFESFCKESTHIIWCSIIYGLIENILFFALLYLTYKYISHLHWKHRYHSDIRNLITSIHEKTKDNIPNQPIETTTSSMGYKMDPLIVIFPWLISPILKWHSLSNFLIYFSYYITYYNLYPVNSSVSDTNTSTDTVENNTWKISYSDLDIIELNWPSFTQPSSLDLTTDNIILHYSVFRSFWNFIFWYLIDYILWKQDVGLTYLFENCINNVMKQYSVQHSYLISDLLLPHLQYIRDLSDIIMEYHGERLEQFVLIKVKLYESFKYFNLDLLFNSLSIATALYTSIRIYYTPIMINLMNPICYIVGITAFIIFVIILVFNGVASDAFHLIREFEEFISYSKEIGCLVLQCIFGVIVWRNMKRKKTSLMQQQNRSLVKDFLEKFLKSNQFHNFTQNQQNQDNNTSVKAIDNNDPNNK